MKFLAHGDSVVSLRFKYVTDSPEFGSSVENVPDKLSFDTVGEIQDAMAQLFPDGNAPFDLQEQILELDETRSNWGDTQADATNQLSGFQMNLTAALGTDFDSQTVAPFMDALKEFMSATSVDLSEFRSETNGLMHELAPQAEKVAATSAFGLELAEFKDDTAELLTAHAKINAEKGEAPNQNVAAFVGRKDQILAQIDKNREPLGNFIENFQTAAAGQLGDAFMAASETYNA